MDVKTITEITDVRLTYFLLRHNLKIRVYRESLEVSVSKMLRLAGIVRSGGGTVEVGYNHKHQKSYLRAVLVAAIHLGKTEIVEDFISLADKVISEQEEKNGTSLSELQGRVDSIFPVSAQGSTQTENMMDQLSKLYDLEEN